VRVTVTPPVGAGPERVTLPVEGLPPAMLDGVKLTREGTANLMLSVALLVVPV
jgi:hypothetical protein